MSEEQEEKTRNLCADPEQLDKAIKLFNKTFRFGNDKKLSYFFDKKALTHLMEDQNCKGIKVFPALEDDVDNERIGITMVVKAYFGPVPDEKSEMDFLAPPPICCPTPGSPFLPDRTQRITYWVYKLMKLLFKKK